MMLRRNFLWCNKYTTLAGMLIVGKAAHVLGQAGCRNSIWASFVAQLVKNPPAVQETWVWSLGWDDPLEKGKITHSSILAWIVPWTIVHGVAKSRTRLRNFQFITCFNPKTALKVRTYILKTVMNRAEAQFVSRKLWNILSRLSLSSS